MKRKIVSCICLIAIFMESIPVSALSNLTSEVTSLESLKESEVTEESTEKGDKNLNDIDKEKIESKEDDTQGTEPKPKLEDNIFNMYILDKKDDKKENELAFSIGFDEKESKFTVSNQSQNQLSKENLNTIIYKINIYDKKNKEKINIELLGSDTGDSEKLNILKETKYEIGDSIKIKAFDSKNGINILGEIQGDISKEKEDYFDGVDNLDYIDNVCFSIESTGLTTIYNEAPVIKGVSDMEVSSFDDFDPLKGVTVEDDHDENLVKSLIIESKDLKENQKQYIYQVTDKWSRSTEAARIITLKKINSQSERTSETSLANNVISVKGIKFGTNSQYGDSQTRFKIRFDDKSRKIKVIDQDGRSMNSRIEDTYFEMVLYNSKGDLKKSVKINGTDRSNTSKLDELRFYGWSYQYGDELRLWHYEAPVKISISGNVNQEANQGVIDFTSELTKNLLETTRFELTSLGLKHILNTPPTITFPEEKEGNEGVVITRGEDFDLYKNVDFNDDRKVASTDVKEDDFDSTKLGEQFVTYTATDNWGFKTVKQRKITVVEKNQIEKVFIKVKSKDGSPMFSLGFDEVRKRFILKTNTENTDTQLNPENKSMELSIGVFNRFNVKKCEFKISGKDTINSNSIQKLNNYKYEEGDYLKITPTNPSRVIIDGVIDSIPSDLDYSSEVDDLDKWVNVRFQLTEGKFKYNYNNEPVIKGNGKIEITRGQKFNVLEGMTVTDDKVEGEIQLTTSNTTVTITSGSGNFLGEQVYEIKYTDPWGRTASVERVVLIKPANKVENQKIELFDGDKIVLSFSYDSIDKKFKVLSYDREYSFLDSEEDNAFVLEFYDSENRKKQKEVFLKSEELIDNKFLEKLTEFEVRENWYMKLWYHDSSKIRITSINPIPENEPSEGDTPENNVPEGEPSDNNTPQIYTSSDGDVEEVPSDGDVTAGDESDGNSSNTDITFKNDDEMENTHFNISNSGITSTYNKAPEIIGANDDSIVYGTTFNPMQGISVKDEDSELEKAVIISGEIDTETLGPQVLHYEVTDSYGRRTLKKRTVTVVPVYTSNEVVYKNENNEKVFSIGINHAATGFTVNLPATKSNESIQEDFIFRVFDGNHQELCKLEINSGTAINEELFSKLKSLVIRPGYFFSVNSRDLTKIQVTGRLDKSYEVSSVDYNNLTDKDRDFVDNVRFELTENIVKAVYNKAPKISIKKTTNTGEGNTESSEDVVDGQSTGEDSGADTEYEETDTTGTTDITRAQAINLDDYNLLEGLSIDDDKDDISVDKVIITPPKDVDITTQDIEKAKNLIGKTVTITYQVADSWGRLSDKVIRNLTIKSAMDDIHLKLLYAPTGSSGEANLVPDINNVSLNMKFNMADGRINLEKGNKNDFKGNIVQYGSFAILDKDDNSVKVSALLGSLRYYEAEDDTIFGTSAGVYINNNVNNIINHINSKQTSLESQSKKLLEYGDKIIVRMYQSPFLHIYGNIINNQEDYSNGAYINGILVNSKFEVTPAGLKQIYEGPTINDGEFSQLTLYNIVAGTQSLNMYLDNTNQSSLMLKAKLLDNEWLQTVGNSHNKLLRITINKSNGTVLKDHNYVERTRPINLVNDFNNTEVEEGDYLTLRWASSSKIKNSKLYNLPKLQEEDGLSERPEQYGFPEEVDYSGEVTNETYFNDVRFYFTSRGIIPVYNSAPTFEGIEDVSISVGEPFDPRNGVSVKDYLDGTISNYTVTSTGPRTGIVDTNRLGEHTLTYSAQDSWGRTGTYERKVNVKSKVHENHFEFYNKDNVKSFSIDFEPNSNDNNGKIKITQFSDDLLDLDRPNDQIVKVSVYGSNKQLKRDVILLGRDSSSSSKLNVLNDFEYIDGDYIKVWRAPNSNTSDPSFEGVKVIGSIAGDTFNFQDSQNGIDHMSNTVFYIRPTGLHAIYNDAPVLDGVKDIDLYYGDTDYNLLNGVTATDQEDNGQLTVSVTPSEINTNKLGSTEITYSVTDSYGRTTSKLANVTVRSKSYLNTFEISGVSRFTRDVQKFYIGFNTDVNDFVFYNSSGESVSVDNLDVSIIPSDLNINLYNRLGRKKVNIQFSVSDTEEQKKDKLKQLQSTIVETFDMIQMITSDHSRVRIKGNVLRNTNNYNTNNDDYGFNSVEDMSNVRFQVKNEGLTEVQKTSNSDAAFEGLTQLTINRGDTVNLLENVTVNHPNEIITEITVSGFDNKKEGTQTVTYSAQDSWGTTFTDARTVEVLPFNDLEKVRIIVSDRDRTELIKVKFDAIESTLNYELNDTSSRISKLRKILSLTNSLPEDTVVLTVSTFNKNMDEMDSISITKGDISSASSKLEELNSVSFAVGGFIGIDIYDFTNKNALYISGPVNYPNKSDKHYQDMRHVRYSISEDGLEAVYNDAPEVIPREEVEHKVGEEFDLKSKLTIKDDRDSLESIEVEFLNYDPYEVGKDEVTATVTDSWGLATQVTFDVYVLSYLDDNTITLKSETGEKVVTIGFNSKTGKLVTQFNEENSGVSVRSSSTEEEIIKLNIYDDKQKNQYTIPITTNDTVETIKQKLSAFENYSYNYNYFIGFEVKDVTKQLINITNVKKEADGPLGSVNYENGVENIDHFNNVRFELNPYGLVAIYNEAPIINYELGDKSAVKSLDVEDYNLLDGVSIIDDKDKLNVKDIDIKYNNHVDKSELNLGQNTITLTIKDNWGRESEPVDFKLELSSAMDNINITFLQANSGLKPDLDKKSAELTFNMDNDTNQGKILVNNHQEYDKFKFNHIQYGAFGIYDKDNNTVFKGVLGEQKHYENNTEFQNATIYQFASTFKRALENINIQYGYKIKIKIYQSPFVYIDGKVINAQEDYSEGANLSEILNESTFTITEEGLVQEYETVKSEPRQNDIVWLSGVAGQKLFTINVDPTNVESITNDDGSTTKRGNLNVQKHSGEPLDTLYKSGDLFSIDVYNKAGNHSYGVTVNGGKFADYIVSELNEKPFEIGGYMTIKIHPTNRNRYRNMKIYGEIDKSSSISLENVDFSGEIKDVAYFNESRFYFTENGLSLVYNEAPAFSGLTDIILLSDDELRSVNLKEGVQVYDDNTEGIEYRIVDANGGEIANPESYRPPSLGAHEIFYTATDSLNRTTKEPRFIWLQSASQINVKNESLLTVQEANPDLQTDGAIMQYLIDLVTVSDEEDDENNQPIKITANNISGTFNPNKPGTYPIKYKVQDSDGNITEETFEINVVRTISVSAPIYIPFQVVTNLIKNPDDKTSLQDPFVSGIMKVSNNYLTNVEVYVKEFTKQSDTGELEIVSPNQFNDWNALTANETMRYMALGIYNKSGFENTSYTNNEPLWLETSVNSSYIGRLPKATDLDTPNIAKLSFVSKHGNKFIGGNTKGKFNLVLEFR